MGVPILDKINVSNFYPSKNVKKAIEEKSKLFGYIGMDAWDLKKEGKINVPELDLYFEKLEQLEKEIRDAEEEKQNKGGLVCSCGRQFKKDMLFCPYCGKPVQQEKEQGAEEQNEKIQDVGAQNFWQGTSDFGTTGQVNRKECICGAKVPEGQFMCMECGRRLE